MNETELGFELLEASPPEPYTSFRKDRFKVLDSVNAELINTWLSEQQTTEGQEPEFLEKLYN